jgi:uncharacterized protein (DUF488 family)
MVLTIGHSTRTLDAFTALLRAHGMRAVVDVRRFPGSRRLPWFGGTALASALAEMGIAYHHEPDLGGRRRARPDSENGAWRNESFRGYADHMQSAAFADALERLVARAAEVPTAILCAEAVPWRCHRTLIADALVARGEVVRHILGTDPPRAHELSPHAHVEADRLTYPARPSGGLTQESSDE